MTPTAATSATALSADSIPAAPGAVSSIPDSEFPIPHSDDPQSDPLSDLSTLLRIAQSAERRLEVFFGDDNPTFNYLDKFNDGIQALWRLVAIRKALIRLDNEIKNPPPPFGVQASACPDGRSSSSASSAPSAVDDSSTSSVASVPSVFKDSSASIPQSELQNPDSEFSAPSVSPSNSVSKDSSSSPIAHSRLHVSHFSLNSNSPIPSAPSPSIPTLTVPNIPAVPDIPAARLTDVKKIHPRLDELEAAMARRVAERIKWGFPAVPYFPIYPKPAPPRDPSPDPPSPTIPPRATQAPKSGIPNPQSDTPHSASVPQPPGISASSALSAVKKVFTAPSIPSLNLDPSPS